MPSPKVSIEKRLAANLERQLGVVVDSVTLTRGYWTHVTQDCYLWEARLRRSGEGFARDFGCFTKASVSARPSTVLSFIEDEIVAEPKSKK